MSQRSVLTIGPCCPTSSSSSSEGEDDEEDDNIHIHNNDTITNEDIDAHYENTNDDDDEQQEQRLPTEDENMDAGKVAAATEKKKEIINIDDDLDDTRGGRGDDDARKEAVLPSPSPEQQRIIQAVQQGQCVTVRACAGSGKTTCMLQVAQQVLLAQPHRNVVIITYNRSLADECKVRIAKLHQIQQRIHCYTIHGLVSRYAGQICNDDNKLLQTLQVWDRNHGITFNTHGRSSVPPPLDLVMLDEAQDLRPLFHKLLSHIFNTTVHETKNSNNDDDGDRKTNQKNSSSMQLCLVGDPKQLLYNFATYGSDKASSKFFLEPEHYWGKFTANRIWTQLPLSVSYRLTPNIATFCNVFWGTNMTGGNTQSPNIPVEYYIKNPFPDTRNANNPQNLSTSFLASIIDHHGPENVLFLAQSVKSERLPIRVHVNELMKISDPVTGEQKYNFHIKESVRGFEGKADLTNKVRVWTFCGSKGCEADVVIVFGFDMFFGRPHGLNQVGVALSRAKKRLLIMHGKQFDMGTREYKILPYYPLLGDSNNGIKRHSVRVVVDEGPTTNSSTHKEREDKIVVDIPSIGDGGKIVEELYSERSEMARGMLQSLAQSGTITVDIGATGSFVSSVSLPKAPNAIKQKEFHEIYVASNFSYFSASSETKFLDYGTWTTIADGGGGNDRGDNYDTKYDTDGRIPYKTDVHFATTKEDVSALYGEAVTYMLQWALYKFVPNIEPILFNGILKLQPNYQYDEGQIRWELTKMNCEPLTPKDEKLLREELICHNNRKMKGPSLVKFMNDRLNIKKKRKKIINHDDDATTKAKNRIGQGSSDGYYDDNGNNDNIGSDDGKSGDNWITFSIKIIEEGQIKDDKLMEEFIPRMQLVYNLVDKEPHHWIYLANGVMAFSNFHEKFRQIGTEPDSYKSWVNASALRTGLDRLKGIMRRILPSLSANDNTHDTSNDMTKFGTFERELDHEFSECDVITEAGNGKHVVGVGGICDWVNVSSLSKKGILLRENRKHEFDVDLLEIKFVHQLCNLHRLQVLVYCALYALEMMDKNEEAKTEDELTNDRDKKEYRAECRGMLYNARTGEIEICSIESNKAQQFLLDISQFKYNGIEHHQKQQQVPSKECKKETKTVSDVACYGSSQDASLSSSSWQSKGPSKKRFQKAANAANHGTIDRNWPKRPKREQDQNTFNNVAGTNDDPIILD